jgi:DNA-binding response OmpR family regulator
MIDLGGGHASTDSASGSSVLLVEDEEDFAFGLKLNLEGEGCSVTVEHDGPRALSLFFSVRPQLVILDLMLPGASGIELLKHWRSFDLSTPVMVLSAKAAEVDRVACLNLGADDYITKPFSLAEFLARVRAQLRRSGSPVDRLAPIVKLGDVVVDLNARTVIRGDASVQLTPKEFGVFTALYTARGRVISKNELLAVVWSDSPRRDAHALEFQIGSLRNKIENDAKHPRYVRTVHGSGYRLELA